MLYKEYDIIIIFFDLCPNNKDLVPKLEKLSTLLYEEGMFDKVHIVPIICSEYIYLSSIANHLRVEIDNLGIENTVNYSKSCEKYYKSIVEKVEVGKYGDAEAEYFYVGYPVFDVVDEKHKLYLQNDLGVSIREISFDELNTKITNFYNYLYSLFGLSFSDEVLCVGVNLC